MFVPYCMHDEQCVCHEIGTVHVRRQYESSESESDR